MKSVFLILPSLLCLLLYCWHGPKISASNSIERRPSSSIECLQFTNSIITGSKARLPILKNSLFDRYPQLFEDILKLEFIPFQLNEFTDSFIKKNSRPPTLREAMEAMYDERRLAIAKYDETISYAQSLHDPTLNDFVYELKLSRDKLNKFKDLDHYDSELTTASTEGKGKFDSLDVAITLKNGVVETKFNTYVKERMREGNFNGEMGELLAYGASMDKPIRKGIKFETRSLSNPIPYQLAIDQAVKNLEENLRQKTDEELIKIVQTYGDGLLRAAKTYLDKRGERPLDRNTLITKIISMIRTKEIDLVFLRADGKIIWAEVKSYKKPISMDTLTSGGYKAKPMSDQLLEHKALRELLGLSKQVELRFISPTSPVSPNAKKFIESLGYEVVGAK